MGAASIISERKGTMAGVNRATPRLSRDRGIIKQSSPSPRHIKSVPPPLQSLLLLLLLLPTWFQKVFRVRSSE